MGRVKDHPQILIDKKICGGSPVIRGTRMRVIDIAIEYDRMGMTADEIVRAHPELKLSQVHAALAYYYENKKGLDKHLKENLEWVEKLKKKYPSKLAPKMENLIG